MSVAGIPPFKVADVPISKSRIEPVNEEYYAKYWERQVVPEDEHCRPYSTKLPARKIRYFSPLPENAVKEYGSNRFMTCVLRAYSSHLPLRLSPDAVWFAITHGLSHHVNANSEKLRSKFVSHEGKKVLQIFVPPSFTDKDWPSTLPLFEEQIARHTLDNVRELVVADFSTTTELSKMCARVALMDVTKSYFDFKMMTCCGIPEISLLGTIDDWKDMPQRAAKLEAYDLSWWTNELLPVLDEFVNAANGKPNVEFFQAMVAIGGGRMSGMPVTLSGWLQVFFPYIKTGSKLAVNRYLGDWKEEMPNKRAYHRSAALWK